MIIKNIKLTNFRCHASYKLDCEGTSLILGENGCGKTSVLEAIYIAMQGKSFRAVDREILKRGEEYYRIELIYNNGEKNIITFNGDKKQFLIEDKKFSRLPKKNRYPVVLFEPSDLVLVGSSPTRRRAYFDRFLAGLDEKYNNYLSKYNKALKQRNEALKGDFLQAEDLFSWNILLARYGCEINKMRRELIDELNLKLTKIYQSIAKNNDQVEIKYLGNKINESEYLKNLEDGFERDKIVGCTGFGVHRDNYEFIFNGVVAEGSASRGEVRSIILALKFIEAEMLFNKSGLKPIVLLDDVFSELDAVRQKCLVENFKDNQVIITSVKGI